MKDFLLKVKSLLKKGYATSDEKEEVKTMFKNLEDEEQGAVEDDLEKVEDLPDEDPEGGDVDEETEKNLKSLIQSIAKEVTVEMKADFRDWMEKQRDSKEKKAGLYHSEVEKKRNHLNDKFKKTVQAVYAGNEKQLKELGGFASRKELTTDSTGSPFGGYAVDSELSAEIRHLTTEYGVARREMSTVTLSKNSLDANSLTTDVSVFWVDEGNSISSTQVVLGQDSLDLKKLAAIVTITSELIQDQEVDLFDFIAGRVAEGFAKAEDEAFFKGDGSSSYGSFTGIIEAGDVNTTTLASGDTAFSDITAEKLLDMQDDTPQGAQANAKYYMHRSVFNLVRKLRADAASAGDSAGEFLYQAPGQDEPQLLWNKPVVLVEAMPTTSDSGADEGFVIYGDLRRGCILGTKGTIAAKRFDSGVVRNVADDADVNLITSDREAVRWTTRVGYIRVIPSALTVLKTASS